MKVIIVIMTIWLLLLSCRKKETFVPTLEYLSIVGVWKSVDAVDNVVVSVENNGFIEIIRNDQRGKSILTTKVEFKADNFIIYGQLWDRLWCTDYNKEIPESIVLFLNNDRDTIVCKVGPTEVNNGVSYTSKFTK